MAAAPNVTAMKVRVGIGLGTRTRLQGPEYGEVVDTIERLGFDSLWLSERISGEAPDPIVAMSYAAGRTTNAEVRHERARAARPQPGRAGQGAGHAGRHVRRAAAAGVRAGRRRRRRAPGLRRRAQGAGPLVRRGPDGDAQVLVRRRRRARRRALPLRGPAGAPAAGPPRRVARRHRPVRAEAGRADGRRLAAVVHHARTTPPPGGPSSSRSPPSTSGRSRTTTTAC